MKILLITVSGVQQRGAQGMAVGSPAGWLVGCVSGKGGGGGLEALVGAVGGVEQVWQRGMLTGSLRRVL